MKWVLVAGLVAGVLFAGCSKPTADDVFAKGNAFLEKNMISEAVIEYRKAVQADPNRADVRLKLADAYLRNGEGPEALRETVLAADLLPNDASAQVKAGGLLLYARAYEDAGTRAKNALAIDPKNVDALILQGNAMAGLKDLDGAMREYQDAISLNPDGVQAYASVGAIQYSRGQAKQAEATFRKAIEVAPKSVSAHTALASFLWASRRLGEAEMALKEAVALDPSSLIANRAMGLFYLETGRAASAEPYFRTVAASAKTEGADLALADYYLALRRPEDARKILVPLSQKAEFFNSASVRLASIEISQNNRPAAATIIKAILAKTPTYTPARVFELRLLLLDGKVDEAMTAATALIKTDSKTPAAAEAYFTIGVIEASRDRTEEAMKAYEEALSIQPRSPQIGLALAQLQLGLGNPDKVENLAQLVLTADPQNPAARALIVRAHLMRNELRLASAELETLEKDYPNSAPVQILVATRNLSAGRVDAARAAYARAASLDPNNVEAVGGLVMLDFQANRPKDAINRVDAALQRMPASGDLYLLAARAYFVTGNFPRAEELLKQTIDRQPARLAAYSLLGQVYVRQSRLPDATKRFQELLSRNPKSIPASTILGLLFEAQGDQAAAERQYKKTLEIDPSAAVAANNLAWLYVSSNRNLEDAMRLALTAVKILPDEPRFNDTVGWVYYRRGLYDMAVKHLEHSVQRDASDPAAHYHLGMAYVKAKDLEKAKASLRKALSMSTSFEGAAEAKKTLAELGR